MEWIRECVGDAAGPHGLLNIYCRQGWPHTVTMSIDIMRVLVGPGQGLLLNTVLLRCISTRKRHGLYHAHEEAVSGLPVPPPLLPKALSPLRNGSLLFSDTHTDPIPCIPFAPPSPRAPWKQTTWRSLLRVSDVALTGYASRCGGKT